MFFSWLLYPLSSRSYRSSITRIKDTGLSKTDVSQERKALAAVQKETVIVEAKHETRAKVSSESSTETDYEGDETDQSTSEGSDGKEAQRAVVWEKFEKKPGSESDSESERNNRVRNAVKNQPVMNNVRDRTPPYSRIENKNSVSTSVGNPPSRYLNSTSRNYSGRQQQVEKKEETRPNDRFQTKGTGNRVEYPRGRLNSNRTEEPAETERTNTRDLNSRRKVYEKNRSTIGYSGRVNDVDSKESKQDEGKERVETKTNEDNSRNAKDEVSEITVSVSQVPTI